MPLGDEDPHEHPHDPAAVSGAVADWYLDPTCRNEFRWWDGHSWTDSVGNNGVESADGMRLDDSPSDPGEPTGCGEPEPVPQPTAAPASGAVADWYPDPTCRNEFRWWDGQVWTDSVGNSGLESADGMRLDDSPSDPGEPTGCAAPEPAPQPTAVPVPGPVADWYLDPTCRHEFRLWDGWVWTDSVFDNGVEPTDQMRFEDAPADPGEPTGCDEPGSDAGHVYWTLEAIIEACSDPDPSDEPGVGTGSDGWPCADRLLARSELSATGLFWSESRPRPGGGYDWGFLQPADLLPAVPVSEALLYITECLRLAPEDGYPGPAEPWHIRFPAEATAAQTCNVAWQMAAGPVNHAGMRLEARCVYKRIADHYHWGAFTADSWDEETPRSGIGWANKCGSFIDPEPDRTFLEKCYWLYGHYIGHELAAERIRLYDQCYQYNLEPDGSPKWEGDGWIAVRGVCGERYRLVEMALRFMHREARELGKLSHDSGIVDHMHESADSGVALVC